MELFTVFLIGFAGSFHCVGMCGPIALALPVQGFTKNNFLIGRFLYNFGRVATYSLLGAIFGLAGSKIIFSGYQQGLSIFLGAFILLTIAIPVRYRNILLAFPTITKAIGLVKTGITNQFRNKGMLALFITGVLNGFLPCGFVYVGLAAAAASGTLLKGAAFMLMFGLGTVPMLLAISTFTRTISIEWRRKVSLAMPYLAAVLGVIFILRGMNLGIKYISPRLSTHPMEASVEKNHCTLPVK